MKRRRNPRRPIVGVRTECVPYGQAMVSVYYCVLECGHKVEGYPDTRDGRKACPECGEEAKRCTWTYDETHFAWDSSCGKKWILMDGGPSENEIRFCHGCGEPVEIACEATPEKARQGEKR